MLMIQYRVADPVGFHARPVTRLVQEASRFRSEINIAYEGNNANLKSIFSVLALAIPHNAHVEITIDGEDEIIAKESIESFLNIL